MLLHQTKTRNWGLIAAICLLTVTLGAFSETVELKLTDGTVWHGEIGGHISLVERKRNKTKHIEGTLTRDAGQFIDVSTATGNNVVYISDIYSIKVVDTLVIEVEDTQVIEIELPKLLFFFHKGYRLQYCRQKAWLPVSQPMIQPAVQQTRNRYAVIYLSGTFGIIGKLPNRKYSTSFITACTLEPAFKEIKKQTKKIRHVVFKIDSTGGDKGAIFDVGLLLDEYSTHFTYHAVVVDESPELNPLFGRFANTYSLNPKGGPNPVSSIADIGRKLGLQEWVEIQRVSSYADKARLHLRKRILDFMAKEEKLFLSILQSENKLEQASLSLKGIYEEYKRILYDEQTFLDASMYEKQIDVCYSKIIDEYIQYETGYFNNKGKYNWDNNMSSLARSWDYCCELVNRSGIELNKVRNLLTEIESQKEKYHKNFDCITVTHQIMRNDFMDNINHALTSHFVNLENEITRLVNYHVLPCFKKGEVLSRRGNYPWYYVQPPCLGLTPRW